MQSKIIKLAATAATATVAFAAQPEDHLVFEGSEGPGKGKHIVLLAGDEEYRSEEAMPMLGQLLAEKHGFKCSVLFSLDKNGNVSPKAQGSLSNSVSLDSADLIVMSIRFRNWDDATMERFEKAYLRGTPMVTLRTSNHGFKFPKESKWAKYSFNAKEDTGWKGGFGMHLFGMTWIAHHGKHKVEGCRTSVEEAHKGHEILNGVGTIFAESDVYTASPKDVDVLLRGTVTTTLEPDSPAVEGDKNNPTQPVAWTVLHKNDGGKTNKIFNTTMGAASDLDDANLRRLVVNACFWGLDLKVPEKANVDVPSGYKPTFYGFKNAQKDKKPAHFIPSDNAGASVKPANEKADGMISVMPVSATIGKTLNIEKDSRIGFIGGGLGSRMNIFNEFETELQRRYPADQLYIRNFCKEGDTPGFRPHPSRADFYAFPGAKELMPIEFQRGGGKGHFPTPDQWLKNHKIDTIIGFFGYTSSFAGAADVDRYKKELAAFIDHTKKQNYNGKGAPQLAIVSPAAYEDLSAKRDLPNGVEYNKNLALYSQAMAEVCKEKGVLFVDAFALTTGFYKASTEDLTSNGHNLNAKGYKQLSPALADGLFGKTAAKTDYAKIKAAVAEKNRLWLIDYKIPNGVHVHGRRFAPYGDKNYPEELKKTAEMTVIRDQALWAANTGKSFDVAAADAKTTKLTPVKTNYKPSNKNGKLEYNTGKEVAKTLVLPKGYEMKLFADEKTFPNLANPSQMAFDNKGRLWVGCMGSYPHYRIGDALPNDKILIFEDTDNDGVADKEIVFVDNIHIPMGFEISDHGGAYVSLGNDLVHFIDTDGDSKADKKEFVISGFDDHDTHHAISSFCADPSGAIFMAEGVFTHTNVETPYGTVRGTNGGFYRFNPKKGHLERTAQYSIPNPWGIAFDKWGQNFFLHTSSTKFSWMQQTAVKNRYNINHASPDLLTSNSARPTSGVEFISSRHFPEEVQGDLIICNNIGFRGAKQHQIMEDKENGGYTTKFRHNLFVTENGNFRPVDIEFAPDGSLYIVDWHNALIGHMQHSARDPNRDHVHGRIYRITYPSRPLVKPAKIAGASIEQLLENLKLPEYRSRYRTRRELRGRNADEVSAALIKWVESLDTKDKNYEHQLTEAMWVSWGINKIDEKILKRVLKSKDHRARAAAVRAVRYNMDKLPDAKTYLYEAAKDSHSLVRHEAVIQATWIDKDAGRKIVDAAKEQTVVKNSEAAVKAAYDIFDGKWPQPKEPKKLKKGIIKDNKRETTVQINCKPKQLAFDVKELKLKKGKRIKLIFNNPDALSHNIVIVKPGTAATVDQAATALGSKGDEMNWLPKTDDIIIGSKLLGQNKKQTLTFMFDKPGKYPFICTFPGHANMMKGTFIVE